MAFSKLFVPILLLVASLSLCCCSSQPDKSLSSQTASSNNPPGGAVDVAIAERKNIVQKNDKDDKYEYKDFQAACSRHLSIPRQIKLMA